MKVACPCRKILPQRPDPIKPKTHAADGVKKDRADRIDPRGPEEKTLAARYSPAADCRSTLAVGALHFRVRNGNGCCLPAMATREKETEDGCKTTVPGLWLRGEVEEEKTRTSHTDD